MKKAGLAGLAHDLFAHFHAQMAILDLDLAECDEFLIGVNAQGIVLGGVELNDGATAHAQQMMNRHHRSAQFDADVDFNLVDRAHGTYLVCRLATTRNLRTKASPKIVNETLTPDTENNDDACGKLWRADGLAFDWQVFDGLSAYPDMLERMKARAAGIAAGTETEAVFLVEHPPLYTAGTSAKPVDLLEANRFPVYEAGRGGQYTYHGPGQRVAYVMLDLRARGRDIRCFVSNLEQVVIDTLAAFNITGERREGRIGVWVRRPERGDGAEDKIAAIGVRVSKWVSYHGLALNIAPDLTHYAGIVPCGISDHGVTSFEDLGHLVSIPEVDGALRQAFSERFGPNRTQT